MIDPSTLKNGLLLLDAHFLKSYAARPKIFSGGAVLLQQYLHPVAGSLQPFSDGRLGQK